MSTASTQAGFVVFPARGLDATQWSRVKASLEQSVAQNSDGQASCGLRFEEAPAEAPSDNDAALRATAAAYRALQSPPQYRQSLFLYVDAKSAASVLAADRGELPEGKAPYVIAVMESLGETPPDEVDPEAEGADFRGWFKVALRAIAAELFRCAEGGTMSPYEMGGDAEEDDVWLSPARFGLMKGAA